MVLIFGGAYQGKLAYAQKRFNLSENDVYTCGDDTAMPRNKKLICGIDKWILALVKADMDVAEAMQRFIECNLEVVVVCNDVCCGVVPQDAILRKWREAVGISLAELARCSSEVVRLFCGIPTRIK